MMNTPFNHFFICHLSSNIYHLFALWNAQFTPISLRSSLICLPRGISPIYREPFHWGHSSSVIGLPRLSLLEGSSLGFDPKKIRYQVGLITDFDERAFKIIALPGPVACFLLPEGEAAGIQLPLLP
jgi:hypothetical protein